MYLYVNGKDKSYVDLDTCLRMGNRYAYRWGECSLLKPDNSGERSFYQGGDRNLVYFCDSCLITLPNKVMCISYGACIFKFGEVWANNICYTREQWISKNPRNYVSANLKGQTASRDISKLTVV